MLICNKIKNFIKNFENLTIEIKIYTPFDFLMNHNVSLNYSKFKEFIFKFSLIKMNFLFNT